jgi:hypothetical protein
VPKVRTYTDETKLGHINDDLDAIYTAVEADTNIDDLADVVITSPADNEVLAYDTGSGDWINQTAAEAGLATSGHDHDSTYLKLDASNDPVTAALEVNDSITISDAVNPQLILNDSGGTYDYKILLPGQRVAVGSTFLAAKHVQQCGWVLPEGNRG